MATNTLLINDTVYQITPAYKAGAEAMRANITWYANPHRSGSQRHDDWDYGHTHEAAGFHKIEGTDPITAKNQGIEFVAPEEECV